MPAKRFTVETVHGEGETVYLVVDGEAPEAEQPAVTCTYSTRSYSGGARGCAEYAAAVLNGDGYKGDEEYITRAFWAALVQPKTVGFVSDEELDAREY